jgi:hypothetical protein
MATRFQVTFDAADPARLGAFWAGALGYKEEDPPGGFASWEDFLTSAGVPQDQWDSGYAVVDPDGWGPRLYFQKVPEGKVAKNRVHLDVNVGGGRGTPMEERRSSVGAEADRLVREGATKLEEVEQQDLYWVVMQDPEGNEFCLQ